MTVVVQAPGGFTVPVKFSPVKRTWYYATGKPVPTEEFPHIHTIELDDSHDVGSVESLFERLNMADYELISVVVDGYDFTEEMVKHVAYLSNVPLFFETLTEDPYAADVICAYILENDCADVDNWDDPFHASGENAEEVVTEWMECFHRVYEPVYRSYREEYVPTASVPSWLSVDWDDTLENICRETGGTVVEFAGWVHYFSV